MARKKLNRQQRHKLRELHANTFNEGFTMGYNVSQQEIDALKKENEYLKSVIRAHDRNKRKVFSAYRGYPQ